MEYLAKPKVALREEADGMVYGYRIVAPRWANSSLSGVGAFEYGGRWNSPGRHVVYLGGSRALSALEMLVHLTTPSARKKVYKLIRVGIPADAIAHYPNEILPARWRKDASLKHTQELGDDWLQANSQLALTVPSALIPEESNILLNPKHPRFSEVVLEAPYVFQFDPRL